MKLITILGMVLLAVLNDAQSPTGVERMGTSSTGFGLDFYKKLAENPNMKNIFMSPTSISLALAMLVQGAKGVPKNPGARSLFIYLLASSQLGMR